MKKINNWLVGIDEVGRGPLAGPITLAVILCPKKDGKRIFKGIRDSKHLTPKSREEWFLRFKEHPRIFYRATSIGAHIIDRRGISFAAKKCIERLLQNIGRPNWPKLRLGKKKSKILLDGGLSAPEHYFQETIIKGDMRVPIISAASIVAKVIRDRKMVRLSRKFPEYELEIHKGYGTRLHQERIKKYGLSKIHRRSFCRNLLK